MERPLHRDRGMPKRARAHEHDKDPPQTTDGKGEEESSARRAGPAARGIWSGSISFGLLQIPVTLFPAESRAEELHFRMLDKHDLSPIRFERVNANTGKKVEWQDIVKGFEYEPDEYVVLDKGDLEKANVRATQTIDIQDFVPVSEIDPAYFETPYFVVPQRRATKAYVLLREALAKKKAAAIATFVLRTREHLVALMPVSDAIMLEILRFGHELRDVDDVPLPRDTASSADLGSRELAMAEQLVESMMTKWEPRKYKDRYYADVMTMIEEKAKLGTAREHHAAPRGQVATDVVDLLDLLKKSVAKEGRGAHRPRGGVKKARPRARRKKTEAA
jgi:DNA end-binding protein Ku